MASSGENLQVISLLYVDDEPDLLKLTKMTLERSGDLRVTTASSAREAIRLLSQQPYDAIVSDYQMPGMDGIEFLKQIRARGDTTPFIIFTGKGREEVVIEALNCGVNFYLQKGGDSKAQFAELVHDIRQAVSHRKAENALKESEEKYRRIIETANEGIWQMDERFVTTFANRKLAEMLEYTPREMIGRNVTSFMHPDDVADHAARITERRKGYPDQYERRFLKKDGTVVWAIVSATALQDPDGTFRGSFAMLTDITTRKSAEQELRENEERYRNVVEDQTEFICRFTPDGRLTFVNDAYCRYFGLDRALCLENFHTVKLYPEDARLMKRHLASLTPDNPVASIDHQILMPSGEVRWQRWNDRAIFDQDGHVIEYQSVGRDITEIKIAEKTLQESEAYYRTIFENTGTASVILEEDTTISLANAEFSSLSGYPREEIEGKKRWTEFVADEDLERMLAQHQLRRKNRMQAERKDALTHYNFRFVTKSGDIRTIYLTVDVIPGTKKSVASLLDITGYKEAEEALRENEEKFRTLLENVPDLILVHRNGVLLFANPAIVQITGYTPDEVLNKSITDFLVPEYLEQLTAAISDRMSGKAVEPYEIEILTKSGGRRTFVVTGNLIEFDGSPASLIVLTDVTDRTHAEKALQESETRSKDLFNNMRAGVAVFEPVDEGSDFVFRDINHAAETIDRVRKEEILGQRVTRVFPGIQEFGLFEVFQRVARTGIAESHPVSIYKDTRITGWRENFVYRLPSGEIVAIYEDVTEKKQAEEATRVAREWLGIALRAAHAGTWDWDVPTGTLTWSPEFLELFGLPPGVTPLFETWLAALHPDDREPAMEKINQSVRDHSPLWNEYRIILPGGDVRWIGAGGSATYNEAGEPLRMSGVCIDITERKRAEEALRQSEEKFRTLLENVPDLILVHRDGIILYVNPAISQTMGFTSDEILATSIFDHIAPEYSENVAASLRTRTTAGQLEPYEIEVFSRSGERRTVVVRATMVEFGGSPAILNVLTDITERKQAEEALRETEERYKSLYERSLDCVYLTDITGNFIDANQSALTLLGYTRDEITTLNFSSLLTPDQLTSALRINQEIITTGVQSKSTEYRVRQKNGGYVDIVTTASLVYLKGKPYAVQGIAHDITERKKVEEALRQSEMKFRSLVEYALEGILILDLRGTILFANNAAGRMVETDDVPGLVGRNVLEFIAPESREDAVGDFRSVAQGHDAYLMQYNAVSEKGNKFCVESIGKVISYEGTPTVLISLRDVTDRRHAEEALQQANKKLNLLSSITRHDILNEVAILRGYIDLAGDEPHGPGMAEYFRSLDKAAKTIQHQIEFTREYQEIGVQAAAWQNIRETVKNAASSFKMGDVALTINCVNIEIYADPLLQKVFYNLFENAFRYAPPFTTIMVTCNETGEGLSVVFADNGVGITAEDRTHLFERGFGKHTGLGLFLSREILAITGITITENGVPGAGARFEMTVPEGIYRVISAPDVE
jgi:PAS domain S-box-containing protein